MRLNYYTDTDSLYIDLSVRKSSDSREISDGVAADYDADGNITGIDIDRASRILSLNELVTNFQLKELLKTRQNAKNFVLN